MIKGGSGKVLACDNCRQRKVRCDRELPQCARCSRLGRECRYTAPSKHHPSPTDMSRLLMTLHDRLTQTEARLAIVSPSQELQSGLLHAQYDSVTKGPEAFQTDATGSIQPSIDLDGMMVDGQEFLDAIDSWGDLDFNNGPQSNNEIQSQANGFPQTLDTNLYTQLSTSSASPPDTNLSDGNISPETVQHLHDLFFDVAHHTIPIINQTRFSIQMEVKPRSPQVQSLSYAVAATSACLKKEYYDVGNQCYQLARKWFEVCERQEDGANLMSIDALQACALITHYELGGKGFARAWMTLGRAMRLAQMMGLDQMDLGESASSSSLCFQPALPPTHTPAELEERRRTFWVLFILDAYASIRSGAKATLDEKQISTSLPSPSLHPDDFTPPMPTLGNVSSLYGTNTVSTFAGVVLMVSLYRRSHTHFWAAAKSDRGGPSYSFWENHYAIDKEVKNLSEAFLGNSDPDVFLNDEFALGLNMNICAIAIYIHETAIVKAEKELLPKALVTESTSRCDSAATEIAEMVQLSQKLQEPKKAIFLQQSMFCMWPLCTAIQVLSRQLPRDDAGTVDVAPVAAVLRLLIVAIEELGDESGYWIGTVANVVERLAEFDVEVMKRRRKFAA